MTDFDTIADTFTFLDDWEARYAFLIDLGRKLEPYPENLRDDAHKVPGCTSQVWMSYGWEALAPSSSPDLIGGSSAPQNQQRDDIAMDPQPPRRMTEDNEFSMILKIQVDSDAHLVKGLLAVLLALYNNKSAAEITAINPDVAFGALGLDGHLSPNRRNGFFAVASRIRQLAAVQ